MPANPAPRGGVGIVYLGSGRRDILGPVSGLRYVVAEQRRHFRADPSDVAGLLRNRELMLKV